MLLKLLVQGIHHGKYAPVCPSDMLKVFIKLI